MATASGEDLIRGCAAVGDLIAAISPDQWAAATPCTEWNTRDVVNHLVGVNLLFAAALGGGAVPEGTDYLGDDPAGAYRASIAALQDAVGRPGVLERSYPSPFGKVTGAELFTIRLADLLTHGWDLGQATGISVDLPDDLVEPALAFMQERLSTQLRTGRFAEPQPIDDTATAIERLAAFAGRQVQPEP